MINILKLFISEIIHKLNYIPNLSWGDNFELVKSLKEDGIYVIENFLDSEECQNLLKEADLFLELNPNVVTSESNGCDLRVYGIDNYSSKFNVQKVIDFSDKVFKKFSFIFSQNHFLLLGKISSNKENLGSGAGWHRDSPFSHQFKTILYLSDVTDENGPFEFIPKTHKISSVIKTSRLLKKGLGERRFTDSELVELRNMDSIYEPKSYPSKAGTLIIADTRALHRGKPLKSGIRFALTRYHFSYKHKKNFFK